MDTTTTLRRNPKLLATDMDGDIVMMDVDKGTYFGLKGVGSYVWAALETPQTVSGLIGIVKEHFDVKDSDAVEADMTEFLTDMTAKGMLETVKA